MRSPIVWRRNAVDRARYEQVIDQRDEARTEAAEHVCKIVELCGENDSLREELAAARRQLARYGTKARTVSDVLEEHDVHRKALAEAIQAGLHLNWEQLIDIARQTFEGATEWRADHDAEKKRADRLQQRLDDCLGLNTAQIADGRLWQHTRHDKKGSAL